MESESEPLRKVALPKCHTCDRTFSYAGYDADNDVDKWYCPVDGESLLVYNWSADAS